MRTAGSSGRLPFSLIVVGLAVSMQTGCERRDGFAEGVDLIRQEALRRNPGAGSVRVGLNIFALNGGDTNGDDKVCWCGCTCVTPPGGETTCTPCECVDCEGKDINMETDCPEGCPVPTRPVAGGERGRTCAPAVTLPESAENAAPRGRVQPDVASAGGGEARSSPGIPWM